MPKNLSRLVLRGAVGFLIGLGVWSGLSVPYARILAALTQTVVRLDEQPSVTFVTPNGTLLMVDRADFPPTSTSLRLGVESTDITFNFILLVTLFAAGSGSFSDRNVLGFAAAAAALVVVHVAAVVSFVEAHYAVALGSWSAKHYGAISRYLWSSAPYFYSVVGVYGFAVSLWWLFRPSATASTSRANRAGRSRRESVRARA